MADASLADMEKQLADHAAAVKALKAKIAERKAKAAAAPPPPPAPAPAPREAPVFVRKVAAPLLLTGGDVRGSGGHILKPFSTAHRAYAEAHAHVRDHASWTKYYNPASGKFEHKSSKVNGARLYHVRLAGGRIQPPRGYFFNAVTNQLVDEDAVLTKRGEVRAAFAGMAVKNRLIKAKVEEEVSATCFLYYRMTKPDPTNPEREVPMDAAAFAERHDPSLKHVSDIDGNYYQEQRRCAIITSKSALEPWLPTGKVWWFMRMSEPAYVPLEVVLSSPVADARIATSHSYETLGGFFRYTSNLAAMKFEDVKELGSVPADNVLTTQNHGRARGLYGSWLDIARDPDAKTLETWLKTPVVADAEMPAGTGCVYDFIIRTFEPSFTKLQATPVNASKGYTTGRYPHVRMTPKWLYEEVFHKGEAYDADNLGLSLADTRKFFEEFRVSLFVLDITGRMVEEACVIFSEADANKHLRPPAAYVIHHGEHVFPVEGEEMVKRITQLAWNSNSYLWRPLHAEQLGKEERAVPSARFHVPDEKKETPVVWLNNLDALTTLDVKVPKLDNKTGAVRLHAITGEPLFHDHLRVAMPVALEVALVELVTRANYEPKVMLDGAGDFLSLIVKVDGVKISISAPWALVPAPPEGDAKPFLPSEELFRLYCEHDRKFQLALCTKQTLSRYSPSVVAAFFGRSEMSKYSTGQLYRGSLRYSAVTRGELPEAITAIDRTKSYTSLLMEMDYVPVFTPFCEFEPYLYLAPLPKPAPALPKVSGDDPHPIDCDAHSYASDPSPSPQATPKRALKPEEFVFKRDGEELVRHYVLGDGKPLVQPELDFEPAVLSGGGGGAELDPDAWREYTTKNLEDVVRGFRREGKSNAEIEAVLVEELGQPRARAVSVMTPLRDRHAFYLVQRVGTLFPDDPRFLLLDQDYNLLTFETWLIVRDWPCSSTLAVLRPFNLVKTGLRSIVKSLWGSALTPHVKKFLANKHVGITGKLFNTRSDTLTFTSKPEAVRVAEEIGGQLVTQTFQGVEFHFVTRRWETALKEGFYPAHLRVLDGQRRVLYEKAVEVGKPILAVDTDCLYYAGHEPELDTPKRNSFEGVGTWERKLAEGVKFCAPPFQRTFTEARLPRFVEEPEVTALSVADEFDTEEFVELFEEHNRVLVLASIPGAGKTYSLLKYFQPLGDKALVVTPYNALACDLMSCKEGCAGGDACVCVKAHTAITFHRLIGARAHGEEEDEEEEEEETNGRAPKEHDISGVTHILFDEVFCFNPLQLAQLQKFMDDNALMPDGTPRKFFAAGDKNQNAPIYASCLNRLEMKAYYSRAVAMLFPNHLTLKVCKRVPVHQRERMNAIRDAVLNTDEDLLSIAKRFFKPISKLFQVTGYAVCSTNAEARAVNEFRQQRVAEALEKQGVEVVRVDGRIYYEGQTLRCRKFHRKPRIYINYNYRVAGFERKGDVVTGIFLDGVDSAEDFPWALSLVRKLFDYSFAHTCHSLQGMSASGGITIFGLELPWNAREWFYTALTRTMDLDLVFYWDVDARGSVTELAVVKKAQFRLALEARLPGYRAQDEKAGRAWNEGDYVDGDHIMELMEAQWGKCAHCQAWLPTSWEEGDAGMPTIDRLNNNFAHIRGNCALACLRCNRARH